MNGSERFLGVQVRDSSEKDKEDEKNPRRSKENGKSKAGKRKEPPRASEGTQEGEYTENTEATAGEIVELMDAQPSSGRIVGRGVNYSTMPKMGFRDKEGF